MSRTLFFVSLTLVSAAVPVVGQELVHSPASDTSLEFSDQSQDVAQQASFHERLGGSSGNCVCTTTCRDWWTCPNPGPNVSFELMWFRPHASDPATAVSDRWSDGSRFTVGYLNDSGQELRVRFFEWDTDAGTTTDDPTDLLYFDTEYAGRFNLGCNWDGELSLGVRYAEFRKQEDGEGDTNFEKSLGPVIGLLLKSRPIMGRARLVGSARYSHQFGKADGGSRFDVASFSVTELQIGLELESRETRLGCIDFRPFFEAQKWAGDYDGSDEDLGLIGMGMLLQVSR